MHYTPQIARPARLSVSIFCNRPYRTGQNGSEARTTKGGFECGEMFGIGVWMPAPWP